MTGEEIKNALIENPELQNEVFDGFKESHVIRSKSDDEAWKTNFEQDLVSKKTREIASSIEEDVFSTTGIEKNEGEKYYDYVKRATSTLLDKSKKAKTLEKQLEELKNTDVDETLKREVSEYKGLIDKLKSEHEEKVVGLKTEFDTERKKSSIASAMNELSFDGDLPEDVVATMKESALNKMLSAQSQFSDGSLVFIGEDGETMRDPESLKPLSAKDILKQSLSSVLRKEEIKKKGLGTDAPTANNNGVAPPSGIKTRMQLTGWLADKGIAAGTTEYSKAWAEAGGNDLPLR